MEYAHHFVIPDICVKLAEKKNGTTSRGQKT